MLEKSSSPGKNPPASYSIAVVSPENRHTSNVIWTEQVIFMYLRIYVYINMCITTMKEKDVTNHKFQRQLGGGTWGDLKEETKRGE